jgi:hypothetical protein
LEETLQAIRFRTRVWNHALGHTRKLFGWNLQTYLYFGTTLLGWPFFYTLLGQQKISDAILAKIAFGVPVAGFFVLIFVWNLLLAPSRIESANDESWKMKLVERERQHTNENDDQNQSIRELTCRNQVASERIQALERERIPRISATAICGRRYWDSEHRHLMWGELRISNLSSSSPLENVEVRIVSSCAVEPKQNVPGEFLILKDLFTWTPALVYWSESEADSPTLQMTVPPSATRTALIAYSDNLNGPPGVFNAPISLNLLRLGGGRKVEI